MGPTPSLHMTGGRPEARDNSTIDNAGVLLLPATVYDHQSSVADGRFRIGLGRRNMPNCLQVLANFLEKDRQRSLAGHNEKQMRDFGRAGLMM